MRSIHLVFTLLFLSLLSGCSTPPPTQSTESVMSNPEGDPIRMQAGIDLAHTYYDSTYQKSRDRINTMLASLPEPEEQKRMVVQKAEPYLTREYFTDQMARKFAVLFTPEESKKVGRLFELAVVGMDPPGLSEAQQAEISEISNSPDARALNWKMPVANQLLEAHFQNVRAKIMEDASAGQTTSTP